MNNQGKISDIKQKIEKIMREKNVILHDMLLFGSRAKGESGDLSDYDLLIIIRDSLDDAKKMELAGLLRARLAAVDTDIDADIIIKSVSEIETSKEFIGGVVRAALKEGIRI